MSKKKICHISTAHSEIDGRILYKECTTLSKAGYDVSFIVTSDYEKSINGVKIIPLSKNVSRRERVFKKVNEAYRKALEVDADIYHFHDPELIKIGKKLKKHGKKVIYDVHEDMPKQILTKEYLGPVWMRLIISKIFNIYEKNSSRNFDCIITPQEKIKEAFADYNDNIVIIKNYSLKGKADLAEPASHCQRNSDEMIIIYVGSITEIRGIKNIISAVEPFKGKVRLWLLGQWESTELLETCKKIKGYEYTEYLGCVPADEIYSYIKCADVGMSILYPTPNYEEAVPTKVFDYMACSKPVILSNFRYWQEMFGDVGIYVDPLNHEEIIRSIDKYLNNPAERTKVGLNNKIVFKNNFSWEHQETKFLSLYERIINKK